MSTGILTQVVPEVKFNKKRRTDWQNLCDTLSENDIGEMDPCESILDFMEKLKSYPDYDFGHCTDWTWIVIKATKYKVFSYYYELDHPDSLLAYNLRETIINCPKLFSWLEQESAKDIIRKDKPYEKCQFKVRSHS